MARSTITLSALVAGALMATFQLVRPWGDVTAEPAEMAAAFADPRWVVAHVAGAASFVALAVLAVAFARTTDAGRPARIAGVTLAAGAALVLPYYGAETFALHEIGAAVVGGAPIDVVALSDSIRMNAVAVALFGVGLLLVAVGGVCLALAAVRAGMAAWAAWPFGILIALALPQFALPPIGRMAYGVVFLVAAVLFAVGVGRARAR